MFVCIAKTAADVQTLLTNAQKALGRSVTLSLDSAKMPVDDDCPALLCVLGEFARRGSDALSVLRADGLVRRHVQYTFLVELPRATFFTLASFGLSVTASEDNFAVVSGRLSDWVHACVLGVATQELNKFFCGIIAFFERESLGEIFAIWEKRHGNDGLFTLQVKGVQRG